MAVFKYTGTSISGEKLEGFVEANDEFTALEKAKNYVEIVSSVTQEVEKQGLLSRDLGGPKKVKAKAIAVMCSQFHIIIRAGMGMTRAVALVADQTSDKTLKRILTEVAEDVSTGRGLASSFEKRGGDSLPVIFYETVRAGEEAGTLEHSFETLHTYFDKRHKVKSKVAGALTYPIFVAVIAVVVVIVMMVAVIPVFSSMFEGFGKELPLITRMLIGFSNFVSHNIVWIILAIVVIIVACKLIFKTEGGRRWLADFKLKMPVLGTINRLNGASQFANTLSTLLASGLSMPRATGITSRVLDNYLLGLETEAAIPGLEQGKQLGSCLENSHYPRPLIEMTTVGEQTGELEETLSTMGDFYDSEVDRATSRALSLLEPIILVVMAVFAGFIVIALYLPMFTMYSYM